MVKKTNPGLALSDQQLELTHGCQYATESTLSSKVWFLAGMFVWKICAVSHLQAPRMGSFYWNRNKLPRAAHSSILWSSTFSVRCDLCMRCTRHCSVLTLVVPSPFIKGSHMAAHSCNLSPKTFSCVLWSMADSGLLFLFLILVKLCTPGKSSFCALLIYWISCNCSSWNFYGHIHPLQTQGCKSVISPWYRANLVSQQDLALFLTKPGKWVLRLDCVFRSSDSKVSNALITHIYFRHSEINFPHC